MPGRDSEGLAELVRQLPAEPPPSGLASAELADSRFGEYLGVLGRRGDWYLAGAFDSIFPVPAGWSSYATGKEDAVLVFAPGGVAVTGSSVGGFQSEPRPEIDIIIGGARDFESADSSQVLAEYSEAFAAAGLAPVAQQAVDSERGWSFARGETETGVAVCVLFVFSRYEPPDASRQFTSIRVRTPCEHWERYYPITRVIVKQWTDSYDLKNLGVNLPERLDSDPASSRARSLPFVGTGSR